MKNLCFICNIKRLYPKHRLLFAGACVAPAPDAGYDPVRYDGIAVMSATGQCQALFAVKYLLHPSSFLRNDEANLSPRLATIGVLPFIAIAIHYTPNPSIFYSLKNNFIISPQREQSVVKTRIHRCLRQQLQDILQVF